MKHLSIKHQHQILMAGLSVNCWSECFALLNGGIPFFPSYFSNESYFIMMWIVELFAKKVAIAVNLNRRL